MSLTTRTKISLAALVARLVIFVRGCLGRGSEGIFRRRGILWSLDLREGIDFAVYLLGGFELSTQRVYKRLIGPRAVVFDVGANIGAHTLPLADAVGPGGTVHAFEATAYAVGKLRDNLRLNPGLEERVRVHHCLLTDGSSRESVTEIHSRWPLLGNSGNLHPQHGGRLEETGKAPHFSLDQFIAENPLERIDLMKLDVDGFEWKILQGSRTLFERFHPPVLLELAPDYDGVRIEEVLQFFWDNGYDFYLLGKAVPLTREAAIIRARIPSGGSINVLARIHRA